MSSVQQRLSGLRQQAAALQESLAAVAVAADASLHASKQVPLSGSPQSKPSKGVSKSKKAALVLDAMKPLLPTTLEQVRTTSNAAGSGIIACRAPNCYPGVVCSACHAWLHGVMPVFKTLGSQSSKAQCWATRVGYMSSHVT